ncbi:MAG: TolC family protein [Betaproteobacteria bacterium]|nr:TolC family protein [Betaproteobacteria bacterium]
MSSIFRPVKGQAAACRRAALAAGVLLFAALHAKAAPLSLTQAEALLLRQNPNLGALTQEAAALRHQSVAISQLPDPTLSLGAVNLPTNSFAFNRQPMTMLSVGVSQSFPQWGKLRLQGEQTDAQTHAALAETDADAAQLTLKLRQAWLDALYAEHAMKLVASQQRVADETTQASLAAYRANRSSESDVLSARIAAGERANAFSRLQAEHAEDLAVIAQLLGLPRQPTLEPHWPQLPAPPSLAQMRERLAGQPSLRAAEAKTQAARLGVAIARRDFYPKFTVSVAYGQSYFPGSPNWASAGVAITLPLFPAKRQDQSFDEAQALASQAQDRYEDKTLAFMRDARSAYARFDAAVAQLQRTKKDLLPTAHHAYAAALSAYQAGRMGMSALLKTEQDVLNTSLSALRYRRDREFARATLDYLATQGATP